MTQPAPTETPERDIAIDMVLRGLLVGPILVLVCGAIWGWAGVASATLALVLVLVNFLLASSLITWAARISPEAIMGAVLGGYIARLGLLTAVVLPIRGEALFSVAPFAVALIVSHLGLLIWELRFVSATLAYPGLAPSSRWPSSLRSNQAHTEGSR